MCKATIDLVSPGGVPVTLEVEKDDDQRTIIEILDRAEKIGLYFGSRGWAFAHLEPVGPSATELAQGPTFAGYPCSPTVDERGLPTWIIVEGKQAQRREKHAKLNALLTRNSRAGREETLTIDGTFVFIGLDPNTGFLRNTGV